MHIRSAALSDLSPRSTALKCLSLLDTRMQIVLQTAQIVVLVCLESTECENLLMFGMLKSTLAQRGLPEDVHNGTSQQFGVQLPPDNKPSTTPNQRIEKDTFHTSYLNKLFHENHSQRMTIISRTVSSHMPPLNFNERTRKENKGAS